MTKRNKMCWTGDGENKVWGEELVKKGSKRGWGGICKCLTEIRGGGRKSGVYVVGGGVKPKGDV